MITGSGPGKTGHPAPRGGYWFGFYFWFPHRGFRAG
jgi:hypothetical protein